MNNLGQTALVIIVGLIGGLAVGIQGPLSGAVSAKLGPVASSFIIHLGGFAASGLLLIVLGGEKIRDWQSIPTPYLFSGIFGLILYLTFSYTLPRIGASNAIALLVAAQMILAMLIDHFGWFGVAQHSIDLTRMIGVVLLIGGAFLISR
jgi:transporter family-2 protein